MADNTNNGSERLTRPEDISALSRYLGEIRKVQEEHTKLGSDVLGLSGNNTKEVPKIASLSDKIDELFIDSEPTELYDSVSGLSIGNEQIELPRETQEFTIEPELISKIEVSRPKLENAVDGITKLNTDKVQLDRKPVGIELENQVSELKLDREDIKLSSTVVQGEATEPKELSTERANLEGLGVGVDLETTRRDLVEGDKKEIYGLYDSVSSIEVPEDIVSLPLETEKLLEDIREKSSILSEDELYSYTLNLLTSENKSELENKVATLFSTYLSDRDRKLTVEEANEYERKLVEYSRTQNAVVSKEIDKLREGTVKVEPNKVQRGDSKFVSVEEVFSNSAIVDGIQSETPESQIDELLGKDKRESVPAYKLPDWTLSWNWSDPVGSVKDAVSWGDKIDVSSYIRWTVENTVGKIPTGSNTRQALIDETLAVVVDGRRKLEVLTKSNRDRLPGGKNLLGETIGNLVSGGLDDAATGLYTRGKQALGSLIGGTDINNNSPKNRPEKNGEREVFDKVSKRVESDVESAKREYSISGLSEYSSFKHNYLQGEGIKTTLSELTTTNPSEIGSVEDLITALTNSPYITSVGKFGSNKNGYNSYTLDGNGYWEIVIEPYVGKLNGGFSYLPAFREMDIWNRKQHGVLTYHNKWIPFTGFELVKSRMISKTLGLYDGEIAFPVSSELTNELRLSIADDSYKSWRWYFQKCMDASVYSSEIHFREYYKDPDEEEKARITTVDKSTQLVSFYKNIAFNIKIYVMTPQYSNIRKFDLLCILREFSEEYSGEIDNGGAADLSLLFSIVGEVPPFVEKTGAYFIPAYNEVSGDVKGYYIRAEDEKEAVLGIGKFKDVL